MKILETNRLILRNWQMSDVEDLYEYAKNRLVGPNAGWKPHESIEESKRILQMFIEGDEVYALVLKESNKVIGSLGLHRRQPDPALKDLKQREVGYVLNPDYWGRGLVPEAVERVIDHCFDDLAIDLLWCGHYDFNMKSKRVNEKCGFNFHFSKEEVLPNLDNKKVTTMYYTVKRQER